MVKKYSKDQVINAVDMALADRIGRDGAGIIIKDVLEVLERPTIAGIIENAVKKELDMDDDIDEKNREDEIQLEKYERDRLYDIDPKLVINY